MIWSAGKYWKEREEREQVERKEGESTATGRRNWSGVAAAICHSGTC